MTHFDFPSGATPLDPNETDGLLLDHISTRRELDRWEQENIASAAEWAFGRAQRDIISQEFICRLHKKMFYRVWRWAGRFRTTMKNLGVDPPIIANEVAHLCADTSEWINSKTYEADEIAARFHHRLVLIHSFPNGNGRHARLMADLLLVQVLGRHRFSWGEGSLIESGDVRARYIKALKEADDQNYQPLLEFVRS